MILNNLAQRQNINTEELTCFLSHAFDANQSHQVLREDRIEGSS